MILQHWFIVDQTFKVSIPEQHDSAPRIYNSKWLSWFHSCATDLCCSESSDFSCVMCGWMRSAFLLCSHGSMNLTNQHTSLWGSGKLWSSLILSTITAAQAHGCKWYMSLTDAVAPCLLVHWQATTTYRSKQWHSTGLCLQAHHCTRSHAKKIRKAAKALPRILLDDIKRKKSKYNSLFTPSVLC